MFRLLVPILVVIKRILGKLWLNKRVARIRYGVAKGLRRRGGIGIFGILKKPREEELFLESLDMKNYVVFDIGCNFGAFTMFFALKVGPTGKVYAFDPLPENIAAVQDNCVLNGIRNVITRQVAIGSSCSSLRMTYDPDDTATASADDAIRAGILSRRKHVKTIEIPIADLDGFMKKEELPKPDLIKIDVEGMEFEVLRGMEKLTKEHRPALFIEIHPEAGNVVSVLEHLFNSGYSIYSVEQRLPIANINIDAVKSGHLFCKR